MISPGTGGRGATSLDLEIEVLGAPVLRRRADPIAAVDPDLRLLVERMFTTMYGARGQGLAAPQVGLGIRLAVVDVPPEGHRHVLINPRVTWASRERARGVEGCLSIPGVSGVVERPAEVVVEALDLEWKLQTIGAQGELARCFQHEMDHLDGILYIDRLSPLSRRMTLARYEKMARRKRRDLRTRGSGHGRGWNR
jgi:peptide deformylase